MPTLNWIGKEAVVNHDKEVPFRLLKKKGKLSVSKNSKNLIIKGDNLEALKALMPYYHNKIKCIYIDPPYNTGNEKWVYNDKVNSPKIRRWLGKVVGGESQDLCRHDKWLCMMYPRLKLLWELLNETGVIFINIDHNELSNLKSIMNEIFLENNYIETIIWRKKEGGGQQDDYIVTEHEYIVMYAKDKNKFKIINKKAQKLKKGYRFVDLFGRKYRLVRLAKWGSGALREDRPTMYFSIKDPDGKDNFPLAPDGRPGRWRYGKVTITNFVRDNKIEFIKKKGVWIAYEKEYEPSDDEYKKIKQRSIFYDIGGTTEGTNELKDLFREKDKFPHPKPSNLVAELITLVTNNNDFILDSFAGSGTTGHAVMKLNKIDGKNRNFILVELERDIAEKITAERVKRAIKKYGYKEGFEFCELDKPLFDEDGQIDPSCSFQQLAKYIYFTETQTNLENRSSQNFIGEYESMEYYLIFNGKGKNTLDKSFLKKLKNTHNRRVVYADKCLLDEETLDKNQIQFKQIPYEVKIY